MRQWCRPGWSDDQIVAAFFAWKGRAIGADYLGATARLDAPPHLSCGGGDDAPRSMPDPNRPAYIVVGGGPAGMRTAQELGRLGGEPVLLFSDESWGGYNRVKLTPLLAREANLGQVWQDLDLETATKVQRIDRCRIVEIDRRLRLVRDHLGREWPFLSLILAIGSRPHRPAVPGVDLGHVFTFRNLNDVQSLIARSTTSRRTAVIGGGLLGLEAARGMHGRGVPVTVIEQEAWLMAQQLDRAGGALLKERIEALGIEALTGRAVRQILGTSRVEGLLFADGRRLDCDTIILCTGIRPNKEIALDAGLAVGRGIRVDAAMRTSDPDIFAVGECAEFSQHLEGLVAPGLEQARVAAINATGGTAEYRRCQPTTRLKVVGAPVFSAGDVEQADERGDLVSQTWRGDGRYRRLLTRKGRIVGAIAVGEWDGIGMVQQLILNRARLGPVRARRFRKSGELPGLRLPPSVTAWPAAATVCNCTGVTRGQLTEALQNGCTTADCLTRITSAATVCGSCKPLLQELVGEKAAPEPARYARSIALLCAAVFAGALLYAALAPFPMATSFSTAFQFPDLFVDGALKQTSGYSLLALSLAAAILSLRKRVRWARLGDFASWRLVHLAIGLLAVGALILHSGLSLGSNLNAALMVSFLATLSAGAVGGGIVALEHRLAGWGPVRRRQIDPRRLGWWLHILAIWPLPALLGLHILTVYFY